LHILLRQADRLPVAGAAFHRGLAATGVKGRARVCAATRAGSRRRPTHSLFRLRELRTRARAQQATITNRGATDPAHTLAASGESHCLTGVPDVGIKIEINIFVIFFVWWGYLSNLLTRQGC
jgi:hypothetical protein